MLSSAGVNPLALCITRKKSSDDRPPCLEDPRPEGAESTLTENAASPFHAEPRHERCTYAKRNRRFFASLLHGSLSGLKPPGGTIRSSQRVRPVVMSWRRRTAGWPPSKPTQARSDLHSLRFRGHEAIVRNECGRDAECLYPIDAQVIK